MKITVRTPASAPSPLPREICDRCCAPAQVTVRLKAGLLAFCQHHYDRYGLALIAAGACVV